MRDLVPYLFSDPLYFERPWWAPGSPEFAESLRAITGDGWHVERRDVWLHAQPEGSRPIGQGFKIHVSATLANAAELLEAVAPECVERGVSFKILASRELLQFMTSKHADRGASGKFIVIYPWSEEEFKEILASFHAKTSHLESGYILSDRRYADSKVLFYRYGGFLPRWRLQTDGAKVPVILDPDGNEVEDLRLPVFKLPPWVKDPFGGSREVKHDGQALLRDRYQVKRHLSFSNAGGVYEAFDHETGEVVVIKEARPFTDLRRTADAGFRDAVATLEHEGRMLSRLEPLPFVVSPVEIFQAWEHWFLVEELVTGVPLYRYRARDEVTLVPFTGETKRVLRFCRYFRKLALRLIEQLGAIHERGVLVGDLSPANILIDPETLEPTFIDFESSLLLDDSTGPQGIDRRWITPGFVRMTGGRNRLGHADDHYGLGMVLFSLILPVNSLFALEPRAHDRLMEGIAHSASLPPEVEATISALLEDDVERAKQALEGWEVSAPAVRRSASRASTETGVEAEPSGTSLVEVTGRIAEHLLAVADPERNDRLWPADPQVFATNPLSVAFGACGVALFLQRVRGSVPVELTDRMAGRKVILEGYPPGLFTGIGGIACAFSDLGLTARGAELLDLSYGSPLLTRQARFLDGLAGWGWANLYLHRHEGDRRFLDRAIEAGWSLVDSAKDDGAGCFWQSGSDDPGFGIAFGSGGVALFLLLLSRETDEGEGPFLLCARRAIEHEIGTAMTDASGAFQWRKTAASSIVSPYWLDGSGGVASVLARFHRELGEERYLELAERAAAGAYSAYATLPSQFQGLAGIGEVMLDLHQASGNGSYLRRARGIAENVLRYRVETPDGLAFPGRSSVRVSCDYATGGAGVGLFLDRVSRPGPRPFHDLPPA